MKRIAALLLITLAVLTLWTEQGSCVDYTPPFLTPMAAAPGDPRLPTFNQFCPRNQSRPQGLTLVPDEALGLARIFNHFAWPVQGTGAIPAYTAAGVTVGQVILSQPLAGQRPYPYPLPANGPATPGTSRLLGDLGAALGASFRDHGSFVNATLNPAPLSAFFGYSRNASLARGQDHAAGSCGAFMRLLENEANHSRPALLRLGDPARGQTPVAGVVDGYDRRNPARAAAHVVLANGTGAWLTVNASSGLPPALAALAPDCSGLSALIGIRPAFSNITLLAPVNATPGRTTAHLPRTPRANGPYRITMGEGLTPDRPYAGYQVQIDGPGGWKPDVFWPASKCAKGAGVCEIFAPASARQAPGAHRWRARGLARLPQGGDAPGPWTAWRAFNATPPERAVPLSPVLPPPSTDAVQRAVVPGTPSGVVTAAPAAFTWSAAAGATYYRFQLYKDRVLGQLVAGTSGRAILPYWYNASQSGGSATGYDVDCTTTPGTCSLPWTAITDGQTVDLTTASPTAHTGPGSYQWTVTPWAAGQGETASASFYLNVGANPPPATPTLYCPGRTMPSTVPYGRADACNVTTSSPRFGWSDTATGADDFYEIYYGPVSKPVSAYFHGYLLRNASYMYAGPSLAYLPLLTKNSDGTFYNATTGTISVTSSILASTGKYAWYVRGINKDAAGAYQFTGTWGNGTFYVSPGRVGPPANLTLAVTRGEAFYPRFNWVAAQNSSWHGVEITAKPVLGATAVTKSAWFANVQVCGADSVCQVNATQVSSSFAYGINPASISWKVTPFNALSGAANALSTVFTGAAQKPPTPRATAPVSFGAGTGSYSWNSSLVGGNATYAEIYIVRYPFTTPFTWLYHDYLPISNASYPAATGNGVLKGVRLAGPAATCSQSGTNWVCTAAIPDANMTKGDATDLDWRAGMYAWLVRTLNPVGYNNGTGLGQWGLGFFTK